MNPELLAYPFLFLAIFFESFVLVTFLSKDAERSRARKPAKRSDTSLPTVAVIVPCWNEGETVAATTDSLLALDYPHEKLSVVLVDNASTDDTPAVMARYRDNPRVTILREEKRGKHNAVNAGIAATKAEIVGCLDADSFVDPGALLEMIPSFADPAVAATTPAMSVHKPGNLVQYMQNAEYIFGITLKHAMSTVNGIHVTPGPFSLYRRAVVLKLGGFKTGHQTEDLEMALRLHKFGYKIENAPRARVYTKAPTSVGALVKQRTRWTSGYLRNVTHEYRSLVGNTRYGALGAIVLPLGVIMIGGGIIMFCVSIFLFITRIVEAIVLRQGVPLSYSLAFHGGFDWFYTPASLYFILALGTIAASLTMISIGKRLSGTPGSLRMGLIAYTLLYGLIAPLWLIRSTADVAFGIRRGWR